METSISICTFDNGTFDVMFEDKATGKQLCLSGDQKMDDDAFELANKIAPACVWTKYQRITPED